MKKDRKIDPESQVAIDIVNRETLEEKKKLLAHLEENKIKELEAKLDSAKWVYEMAGKIKSSSFTHRQFEFFTLLMLKQVKEAKEYRLKYGMNWEDFCEYVGLKRRNVDIQLEDLEPFRVEFLAKFATFLGDDISKIKYLGRAKLANFATFDDENIIIGDEKIPCIPERAGEITAILDKLQEETRLQKEDAEAQKKAFDRVQGETHKSLTKLEKELKSYKGFLEDKGINDQEKLFLHKIEFLKKAFDGFLVHLDPENIEELQIDKDPTPRMRAEYIAAVSYMKMQILIAYERAISMQGDCIMTPEDAPGNIIDFTKSA